MDRRSFLVSVVGGLLGVAGALVGISTLPSEALARKDRYYPDDDRGYRPPRRKDRPQHSYREGRPRPSESRRGDRPRQLTREEERARQRAADERDLRRP